MKEPYIEEERDRSKMERKGRELNQTEIKEFIASNGLGTDLLSERDGALEAWRQECNLLIRGFVNYLGNRFSAIEHRLDRLEQQVHK